MSRAARFSRRTLLRGSGIALALPWLESLQPTRLLAGQSGGPPVRLGYFYVPNGVNMEDWRPAMPANSQGMTDILQDLPKTLQPLEKLKDQVLVISNLAAEHCTGAPAMSPPVADF